MSDRFKFRVWDSALQRYRTDFFIGSDGNLYYFHDSGIAEMEKITSARWTVEQCTGMKDKNGKLIFEGDRIHVITADDGKIKECSATVVWGMESSSFGFRVDGYNWSFRFPLSEQKVVEVIGNIHEGVKK